MFKMPHLEINCIPSQLNTSKPTGVTSQLASMAENSLSYDGVTIDQMRGNPLYGRGDKIDTIGLAQKALADAANIVKSRASLIRKFNHAAQHVNIPKQGQQP